MDADRRQAPGPRRSSRHRAPEVPHTVPRWAITTLGTGVGLASCLTVASLAGAFSDASSVPTGDVVVFGDSYYSSPDRAALARPCAQSTRNWPRLVAEQTGRTIHDWTCGGATSETLLTRIREATDAGELGPGTTTVVLSIGGNDFAHQGAVRGLPVTDLQARRDTVLANVATAVASIRDAAPGVKLVMSSYLPSTVGPYVCRSAGPVDGVSLPVYDQQLNDVEGYISDTMGIAARDHGASFVDLRSAAEGNSTCSPTGERFVAGEDDGAPDVLMAWHPTQAGVRFMADQLTPQLIR